MSTSTISSPVFANRLLGTSTLAKDVALVVGSAAFVGLLAQVSVPMWPVPVTGQTLGVMLVGAMLGARRGGAALATYAMLGLAGVPWFANHGGGPAYILQPSFGFVIGFVIAAWTIGALAERRWDRKPLASLAAFGIASVVPFLVGIPWMWAVLHFSFGQTLGFAATMQAGLIPFIPGGIVKWLLGSVILSAAWKALDTRERRA